MCYERALLLRDWMSLKDCQARRDGTTGVCCWGGLSGSFDGVDNLVALVTGANKGIGKARRYLNAPMIARLIRRSGSRPWQVSPVGAENLRHQAVFVNHALGAIAPPDAEVVQVGDAIWRGAERRCLVQGAVRPVGVAVVFVFAQHGHQVSLIPHQGPVPALRGARSVLADCWR